MRSTIHEGWFEPVLFMTAIGVAIMLNRGTNLMFGTISFVTNAAGSVLQLAVSMDYAIFLLHRFSENRHEGMEIQEAMVMSVKQSVGSVLSSLCKAENIVMKYLNYLSVGR